MPSTLPGAVSTGTSLSSQLLLIPALSGFWLVQGPLLSSPGETVRIGLGYGCKKRFKLWPPQP